MQKVIITSPSLNPEHTVSGISSVAHFIISNNKDVEYIHFEVGKRDAEAGGRWNRVKRVWRNCREWKRLLKIHKDSIVHYNMPLMTGAIIRDYMLLNYAHRYGNPILLHLHGGNFMTQRQRPWLIRMMLKHIFSWVNHVVVLGEEEKKIVEEDFQLRDVTVLPNCIDLAASKKYKRNVDLNRSISLLYIGRIEPNKGIDYIYDAVKELMHHKVDFIFNFAGKESVPDSYIPRFENLLGNRFIYHGVVAGTVKEELYKSSDVFVLPSYYEGLPMALLEAMSFGLVPVVTSVGSIPMVITHGFNGFFVPLKESAGIVDSIIQLAEDPDMFRTMSKNAQGTIFEMFDDEKYISQLNMMYLSYDR